MKEMHMRLALSIFMVMFFSGVAWSTTSIPYMDATLPIEKRVEDLLSRMTLEEKAAQLTQQMIGRNDNPNNQEYKKQSFNPYVGSVIYFQADVEKRNAYQRKALEETRLGIPLMFAYDVIHGFRTVYPISLAQACSFNTNLVEQAARIAALEASASGLDWTFSPMVDVARDPRWGRVSEGYGEDPMVNAAFCVATVRGYQGEDLSAPDTVAACLKHYVGYSESMAGIDYAYSDISDRALWETYFPPFEAGVRAGVASVMSGFNDINGIPAVCNSFALKEVLRKKWGFDGVVVSDWNAIRQLKNQGFSSDPLVRGSASLKAGNDIDMMSNIYMKIPEMVNAGLIKIEDVDAAVRNVLRLKFRLGLFERPYTSTEDMAERYLKKSYRDVAEQLAIESAVLLKNRGILPLTKRTKIFLAGNLLSDKEALLGSWLAHGNTNDVVGIREGIEAYMPSGTKLVPRPAQADVILLCLGETKAMSGENGSRSTLQLHNADEVERYEAFDKPIVLVVGSGRPIAYQKLEPKVNAILHLWQPGVEAGHALAKLIFGLENPSGKLAMTFPRSVGQVPIFYNRHQSARVSDKSWSGLYQDIESTPMYPFGYGLSYTTFAYEKLAVDLESMEATVVVKNTGKRAGQETLLWYVGDPEARITQPMKKLKHFEKILLESGEARVVRFALEPGTHLSYVDASGNRHIEPGRFVIEVGSLKKSFNWMGE
tara:strand:- start:4193 stop:6328 length:2136 start_codon:yes stop_codon:yes gene_type:complete